MSISAMREVVGMGDGILGGKARDVGAHGDGRRAFSRATSASASRAVAALHAQDQIGAMLQREMEMRHHPRLAGQISRSSSSISTPSTEERRRRGKPVSRRIARQGRPGAPDAARSWPQLVRSTPVSTTSRTPAATCAALRPPHRRRSASGWAAPLRMMQKVQAWSQPFCTATKARVCWRGARPQGAAGTFHARASSLSHWPQAIDLGHGGDGLALDLGGAAA
jgi:hypothetical protein